MNLTEVSGFLTRDGTVDANAVYSLPQDEYRLWHREWSGWAIDVGAQIGTVGITLARANPNLRVLCVEAVGPNSDLLERNIDRFRVGARVTSIRAFAAKPGTVKGLCHYGYRHRIEEGDSYVSAHRYVGGTWRHLAEPEFSVDTPAVSLDSLLAEYEIDDLRLLKIDCEGCEWAFLDTPAVSRVQTIIGEYHGGYTDTPDFQPNPRARITELLGKTHEVTFFNDEPIIGLFEATRR